MRADVSGSPSGRTALFLYVLLVVLPAVVFGGLLWRQLGQYQDRLLTELPVECRDAAGRLEDECNDRINDLLDGEHARHFEEYNSTYYRDEYGEIKQGQSPLAMAPRQEGVLGYFSFRESDITSAQGDLPEITVLRGLRPEGHDPIEDRIRSIVKRSVLQPLINEGIRSPQTLMASIDLEGYGEIRKRLQGLVMLNVASGTQEECLEVLRERKDLFRTREHDVYLLYLSLQRVEAEDGNSKPWVLAVRTVVTKEMSEPNLPPCVDAITRPVVFCQGLVLDPDWLFGSMPAKEADRLFGPSLSLLGPDDTVKETDETTVANVGLLSRLGLDSNRSGTWDAELLRVTADAGTLRREFSVQNAWFAGMALILTISMAIGIRLLLASVRAGQMEAERTRNFVASVTHELRTPIAAVKLYGEMLRDGWVSDGKKRGEYLQRIVSESDRLAGLVDRVLLRRKLFDRDHSPTAGDLNLEVVAQRSDLEMVGGRAAKDLAFDLQDDLPAVLLLPEGVHVVLQNLVENARKYAPVALGDDGEPTGEPIFVRTRTSQKGRVLLEVLDRGPGIAEKDRTRIFDAFLRLGDEQTRRTKGTGLGLHLVALQAKAMRGKVRALPRAGGGTLFQVIFARAR